MPINLGKKKHELKEGEKIRLCYDECFKIMFGNENRLERLTLLLSYILDVDYKDLEGRISLVPLVMPNEVIGEKKRERDVVVELIQDKGKIILEVNFKPEFYQEIIDRNLNYLSEVASKGLKSGDGYDKLVPTLLVNFNTFGINDNSFIFDEYMWRNEEGEVYTKNQRILNINIEACYFLWYNDAYMELSLSSSKRDLLLLGAAMYTDKVDEFNKCIEELNTSSNIKNIIEEESLVMNGDTSLRLRYTDFLEETRRINRSILHNAEKKGRSEGIAIGHEEAVKEMIFKMHKENININTICRCVGLDSDQVNEILNLISN